MEEVKGSARVFMGKQNISVGQLESNLANFITDAFVDYVGIGWQVMPYIFHIKII